MLLAAQSTHSAVSSPGFPQQLCGWAAGAARISEEEFQKKTTGIRRVLTHGLSWTAKENE